MPLLTKLQIDVSDTDTLHRAFIVAVRRYLKGLEGGVDPGSITGAQAMVIYGQLNQTTTKAAKSGKVGGL
jgi:hypothetical protein